MHNDTPSTDRRDQAANSPEHHPPTASNGAPPNGSNDAPPTGNAGFQGSREQGGKILHSTRHRNDPKYGGPQAAKPSIEPQPAETSRRWLGMFPSSGPDLTALQDTNRALEAQVQRLSRDLESTKNQLVGELMEKDAELAEMKKTLCMYNDCSEVELGEMVGNINKKTRGLARSVASKWIKDAAKVPEEGGDNKPVTDDEVKFMNSVIGTQLVNALGDAKSGRSKGAPYLLQYAWQACIVTVTSKILRSFSAKLAAFPEWSVVDKALQEVSNEVMKEEVQPAYGRWRFITHRHLTKAIQNEEKAIQAYAGEVLGLCLIAGRLILRNRCPDDLALATAFKTQLEEIIMEAFRLLTSIQEKMMTTNYGPCKPSEGSPFQPEAMDLNDQDERYSNDVVVCATGIGLLYWRKDGRENTNRSPTKYIFKKPQVLTVGNLNDIITL